MSRPNLARTLLAASLLLLCAPVLPQPAGGGPSIDANDDIVIAQRNVDDIEFEVLDNDDGPGGIRLCRIGNRSGDRVGEVDDFDEDGEVEFEIDQDSPGVARYEYEAGVGGGCNGADSAFFFVILNDEPSFDGGPDVELSVGGGSVTIDLNDYFSDPDEDAPFFPDDLAFGDFDGDDDLFSFSVSGSEVTFTPKSRTGDGEFEVRAFDNRDPGRQDALGDVIAYEGRDSESSEPGEIRVIVSGGNAGPEVDTPLGTLTVDEDSGTRSVDLSGVFTDPDGDALTLSVADRGDASLLASVSVSGTTLRFTPAADAHGRTTITLQASDGSETVTSIVDVVVDPVDDVPVVVDDAVTIDEDTQLTGFDALANDSTADEGPLEIVSVIPSRGEATTDGSTIGYEPELNDNGEVELRYEVRDGFGDSTATGTVTVTIRPVNDVPTARDDSIVVPEGAEDVIIDVTANDVLADAPVTIVSVGTTHTIDGRDFDNSTETTPTTQTDATGDEVTRPNGFLSIVSGGTAVSYTGKDGYTDDDFFTYVLEDADGDRATGRVDIRISSGNSPPTAPAVQTFDTDRDTELSISAEGGLLAAAFDADGDQLSVRLATDVDRGTLDLGSDGSFSYTPPAGFTGTVEFGYFVSDGIATNEGGERIGRIDVETPPAPPSPPDSGTVEDLLNLSDVPLELTVGIDPNVLIVMDDSGSMDFTHATNEDRAVFNLTNRDRDPRPDDVDSRSYDYVIDLPNNTYSRGGVPAEREILGSSLFRNATYGVWRARHHDYNRLYYDPAVRYRPWQGLAPDGQPFPPADPGNAALNPIRDGDGTIDLRAPRSYRSFRVPRWTDDGDSSSRTNEDYYIPRYYRITDPDFDGEPAWDTPHELVEIRPRNESYSQRDRDDGVPVRETRSSGVYPGGPSRTDCADPLNCSYDEEIQNFANWFVYYRSREYTVKAALGGVVVDATGLNIGYATINRDSERQPLASMESSFRSSNKRALLDQIYEINSSGGTPLRRALDRAGRHYECISGDTFGSSGSSSPGDAACPVAAAPAGACQQHFTLLFTDGVWSGSFSGIGNEDVNSEASPFDGDIFADNVGNTLADIAMQYYERDLHDLEDLVPTSDRDRDLAPDGIFGGQNDEFMHQHMTTFTVGFGVDGLLTDDDIPSSITAADSVAWPNPFSASRAKIDDLRHAALNGRGDYLSAADATVLEQELRAAFEEFAAGAGAGSAVAFNSQQLREGSIVFRAIYNTDDNTGDVIAQEIDLETEELITPFEWSAADVLDERNPETRVIATWDDAAGAGIEFDFDALNAAQQAALPEDRLLYLRGDRSNERPSGTFRERPGVGSPLGDVVSSTPVFVGEPELTGRDVLPFPVGDGDLYSQFRRTWENRTGMVYVGANDGMLHAFDSANGAERFAYVPDLLIRGVDGANDVAGLADANYTHEFFVDGPPAVNDVFIDTDAGRGRASRAWRTVLVGSLRGGGKGLFAIDVTDPAALDSVRDVTDRILWEFSSEDDAVTRDDEGNVVRDDDGDPVKDLGFTYAVPTIAMTNINDGTDAAPEHRWMAILGNGYNASGGVAKLFAVGIEAGIDGWGDGDVIKLSTEIGSATSGTYAGVPNGLGEPRLVDLDGNGTVDYVYAGDLRGYLYRFDLTSGNPDDWSVTRIFRALYTDGTPQPITKRPIVTPNPQAQGLIITVASGSFITEEDGTSEAIQSIYGVWDIVAASPFSAEVSPPMADGDRSLFVEQEIINLYDSDLGALRTLTSKEVVYDADSVRGWVVDFDPARPRLTIDGSSNPDDAGNAPPAVQFPGERAVRNLDLRGGFLFVNTVIPRDDLACVQGPGGFAMSFNPVTGGSGGQTNDIAFDLDNDGRFDDDDRVGGGLVQGLRFDDAVPTDSAFIGQKRFTQLSNQDLDIQETNTAFGTRSGRLSWREFE